MMNIKFLKYFSFFFLIYFFTNHIIFKIIGNYFEKNKINLNIKCLFEVLFLQKTSLFIWTFLFFCIILIIFFKINIKKIKSYYTKRRNISKRKAIYLKNSFSPKNNNNNLENKNENFVESKNNFVNFFKREENDSYLIKKRRRKYYNLLLIHFLILKLQRNELVDSLKLNKKIGNYPFTLSYDEETLNFRKSKFFDYTSTELFFLLLYGLLEWFLVFYSIHLGLCFVYDFNIFSILFSFIENFLPIHFHAYLGYIKISMLINSIFFFFFCLYTLKEWVMELTDEVSTYQLPPKDWFVDIFLPTLQAILLFIIFSTVFFLFFYNGWAFFLLLLSYPIEQLYNFTFGFFISLENLIVLLTLFDLDVFLNLFLLEKPGVISNFYGPFFSQNSILYKNFYNKNFLLNFNNESFLSVLNEIKNDQNNVFLNSIEYQRMLELKIWKTELLLDIRKYNYFLKQENEIIFYKNLVNRGFRGLGIRLDNQYFLNDITFLQNNSIRHFRPNSEYLVDPIITHKFFNENLNYSNFINFSVYPSEKNLKNEYIFPEITSINQQFSYILPIDEYHNDKVQNNNIFGFFQKIFDKFKFFNKIPFINYVNFLNNEVYLDIDFLNNLNFRINSRYIYNDLNYENLNLNFHKNLSNYKIPDNVIFYNNKLINLEFLPDVFYEDEQELIKLNIEALNLNHNLQFKNIFEFKKYIRDVLIMGNNLENLNKENEILNDKFIKVSKENFFFEENFIKLKKFLFNKNDFVSLILLNMEYLIEKQKITKSSIYSDEIFNLKNLLKQVKDNTNLQNNSTFEFLKITIKNDFYYPFFNFFFKPFYYRRTVDLFQFLPRIDTSNSSYYYYNPNQPLLNYFWDAYSLIKSRLLKIYANFPPVLQFNNRKNILYLYNISEKIIYNKNSKNKFLENDFYDEISNKFFSSYYNMEIKIQNFGFLQNTLWNKHFHQYYNATLITENYETNLTYLSLDEKSKLIFIPNNKRNLCRFAQLIFPLNWKVLKDRWIEYPQQDYIDPYLQYMKYITNYSDYKKLELEYSPIVLDHETYETFDGFRNSIFLENNNFEKEENSSSYIIDRDLLRSYNLNDYMALLVLKDYHTSFLYDRKNILLNYYLNYIVYFKSIFLLTNFENFLKKDYVNNYDLIINSSEKFIDDSYNNKSFLDYLSYNDLFFKTKNFSNVYDKWLRKREEKKYNLFHPEILNYQIMRVDDVKDNLRNNLRIQKFKKIIFSLEQSIKIFCGNNFGIFYKPKNKLILKINLNYFNSIKGFDLNLLNNTKCLNVCSNFFENSLSFTSEYKESDLDRSIYIKNEISKFLYEDFFQSKFRYVMLEGKNTELFKSPIDNELRFKKFKILIPYLQESDINSMKYMFDYFNLLPKQEEVNAIFDRINLRLYDFINRLTLCNQKNLSKIDFNNNYILFSNVRNFAKLKGIDPWNLYLLNKNENIYDFLLFNIEFLFCELPYDELLDPADDHVLQMDQLTYQLFPYRLNYSIRGLPFFDQDISKKDFKKIISFYLDKTNFLQFDLKIINEKLQNKLFDFTFEKYKQKFYKEFINDVVFSVGEGDETSGISKILKTEQRVFSSPNSRHYFVKSDIFRQLFFKYKINPYLFQMFNFPYDNQYSNVWSLGLHNLLISNQIFDKFNMDRIFGKELINNQFRYKRIYFLKTLLEFDEIEDYNDLKYYFSKKAKFKEIFHQEKTNIFNNEFLLTPKYPSKKIVNSLNDVNYIKSYFYDLDEIMQMFRYQNVFFKNEFDAIFFVRRYIPFGELLFDDIGVPFYDWFVNDEWVSKRFRKYGFRIFKTYRTFYNKDDRFGIIDFFPRKKIRTLQSFLMLEKPQQKKRKILKKQFVYNEHKLLIYKFLPGVRSRLPAFDSLVYRWVFVNNKIKPVPTILIFRNNQIRAAKIKNYLTFLQLLTNPIKNDFGNLFWNYYLKTKNDVLFSSTIYNYSYFIDWNNNFWEENSGKIYAYKYFSNKNVYFYNSNDNFAGYNRLLFYINLDQNKELKVIDGDFYKKELKILFKIFINPNNFNLYNDNNLNELYEKAIEQRQIKQTKYFSRFLILNSKLNHLNFYTPKEYEHFQIYKWQNWLNINKFRKIEEHYVQYNLSKDKVFLYTSSDGDDINVKEIEEFDRLDNQFLPIDSARTHVREREEDELPYELSNPKKYYVPYNHHSWFYNNLESSYPIINKKLQFYSFYSEDFDLIRKQTLNVLKRKIEFDCFQIQKIYQINDLLYKYSFKDSNFCTVNYFPDYININVMFYYLKVISYFFYYQFFNIKGNFFINNNFLTTLFLFKIKNIPYIGNIIVILYNFFFSLCIFFYFFIVHYILPFLINFSQSIYTDFLNFYKIFLKLYIHPFWFFFTYSAWLLYYFLLVRFFTNNKQEYNFKNIFAQFDWDEELYNFDVGRRKYDTKSSFEFMKPNYNLVLKNMNEFLERDKNPTIEEIKKLNVFNFNEEIFRKNFFSKINYKNYWFLKKFPNYQLMKDEPFSENTTRQTDKFIYNYFLKPISKFYSNQGFVGKSNFIFNNTNNIQKLKLKNYIDILNKDLNRHSRHTSEYGRFKWIFVASIFYFQFLFVVFVTAFLFFIFL